MAKQLCSRGFVVALHPQKNSHLALGVSYSLKWALLISKG